MKTTVTHLRMDYPQEQPVRSFTHEGVAVEVHPCRENMGAAAARHAHAIIAKAVDEKGTCRVLVGCAPSQDDFFREMVRWAERLPELWQRVELFHMDDYVGLKGTHPASFRAYLREHLLDHAEIGAFHPIPAEGPDSDEVCDRYAHLLAEEPIDLICLGIGENGHVAFNDPPVADFDDPKLVKVVELDTTCRQQQVNDGCFPDIDAVPRKAVTLTIPVFRQAARLSVHVKGPRKAKAVHAATRGPVSGDCPASFLRQHSNATLYLDRDAAGNLLQ